MSSDPTNPGAVLLQELRGKSSDQELFASLQTELRYRAHQKMRAERRDHTLRATALVNEAFIRLFKNGHWKDHWENDQHAINAISLAMERILLDHAESRAAKKRGGGALDRVPLDQTQAAAFSDGDRDRMVRIEPELMVGPDRSEELLSVRDALQHLREIAPRQAEVVRLQFYGGLTQDEIAATLGVSLKTVKLDSRKARVSFLQACMKSVGITANIILPPAGSARRIDDERS